MSVFLHVDNSNPPEGTAQREIEMINSALLIQMKNGMTRRETGTSSTVENMTTLQSILSRHWVRNNHFDPSPCGANCAMGRILQLITEFIKGRQIGLFNCMQI
jgi:hypothetical protein